MSLGVLSDNLSLFQLDKIPIGDERVDGNCEAIAARVFPSFQVFLTNSNRVGFDALKCAYLLITPAPRSRSKRASPDTTIPNSTSSEKG